MSALYRKRPIPVEARQVPPSEDGAAGLELAAWCGGSVSGTYAEPKIFVPTLEGDLAARVGDWIVKGPHGEFWPVKGSIFTETYEQVDADFFQVGHVYAREHRGRRYAEFRVTAVDTSPDGEQRLARGWRTDAWHDWEPTDSDDMGGWTDVTEEVTS